MQNNISKNYTWVAVGMALIAFVGFLDSTFLTINHYSGDELTCTLVKGCEVVTNSVYSTVGNIPVALLGSIYYLVVLISALIYFDSKKEKLLIKTAWFSSLGFLASVYFLAIQAFVLKAFCQYCLVSAFTSTVLFVLGIILIAKSKKVV